ncbi:unnamed protein product [Linum trigynum]|uniref:Uncharacterized protein n=1 Tax=Linum trigynum TaxID=586398 RepID=A0AAV2E138_9ROSI
MACREEKMTIYRSERELGLERRRVVVGASSSSMHELMAEEIAAAALAEDGAKWRGVMEGVSGGWTGWWRRRIGW